VANTEIQLHIDLGGLPNRMQRVLKATMNFVAIGLNSAPGITTDSFAIPDTPIQHQFDSNNPWTTDQAKQAWRNHIAELQRARGSLLGEDWNTFVVQRGHQFHKRTLPQRLEFLEKNYSFTLDTDLVDQINTINIARNCLSHRGGVITTLDANVEGALQVRWTALVALVISNGKEIEIHPPHFVEAGASLAIGNRRKSKRLAIGQQVDFTSLEFAQMCWTFFLFAQSCAKRLEDYGRQRGVQFGQSAT